MASLLSYFNPIADARRVKHAAVGGWQTVDRNVVQSVANTAYRDVVQPVAHAAGNVVHAGDNVAHAIAQAPQVIANAPHTFNNDVIQPIHRDVIAPIQRAPQTFNNDVIKPIQRDVFRPISNAPQTFGNDVLAPLNRDVVKPVVNASGIPAAIDTARLGAAELTHNNNAIDATKSRLATNVPAFLPVAVAEGIKQGDQAISNGIVGAITDGSRQQQLNRAVNIGQQMADDSTRAYRAGKITSQRYAALMQASGQGINVPAENAAVQTQSNPRTFLAGIGDVGLNAALADVGSGALNGGKLALKPLAKTAATIGGLNAATSVASDLTNPIMPSGTQIAKNALESGLAGAGMGPLLPIAGELGARAIPRTTAAIETGARKTAQVARETTPNAVVDRQLTANNLGYRAVKQSAAQKAQQINAYNRSGKKPPQYLVNGYNHDLQTLAEMRAKAASKGSINPDYSDASIPVPESYNKGKVSNKDQAKGASNASKETLNASSKNSVAPKDPRIEQIRQVEASYNDKTLNRKTGGSSKAAGYRAAALQRGIDGKLTSTEASNIAKYLNSNYVGKQIPQGEIVGNSFGRVRVKTPAGSIISVEPQNIKSQPASREQILSHAKAIAEKQIGQRMPTAKTLARVTGSDISPPEVPKSLQRTIAAPKAQLEVGQDLQKSAAPRTTPTSFASRINEKPQNPLPAEKPAKTLRMQKPQQSLENPKNPLGNESQTLSNNTPVTPASKQRGLVTSVKNSDQASPTVRKNVSGSYTPRSTAQLALNADKYSKGGLKRVTTEVNDSLAKKTGTINDQEIANAIAVAKRNDAQGNYDAAQQIYDKLAEHGTKGGQAIQAFSLLKNRTPQGMKFQALRSLKKAGIELNPSEQKELGRHIDIISKTRPNTTERDMAIHNLVQFVNKRIPTGAGDKIVNFWRAGLLTSPVTTGGNILGNTSEALTRNIFTNPIGAAADKVMSLFTGKRTKTLVGGQLSGGKLGLKKAGTYLKTGFDERNPNAKFDAPQQLNYNNKAIGKYVNGVYRWMGGQDQPFYYAAKNQAARDLATADVKNLGLKGQAAKDYITKAENDPNWKPQTFKSKSDAEKAAKYSVYQNDTLIGHMASGMKEYAAKHSKAGGAVANFLLPFTRVPASVAMRIIDRTPLGTASEAVKQLLNVKNGRGFDQRAMAEAIGNGSFGIGVFAAGAALAKSGLITGAYPTDPKERALWKSEGKQEYSVKIGNRWYSLNYIQPFGAILAIGAQVHNDQAQGASFAEAWNKAGATALQSVQNQSFLQGINGALDAINNPQESASQYLTSTASSAVPNFIRTTARATDPLQRNTKGVVPALKGAIPGLRETLPAKQDMFGKPLPGYDNAANQLANPLRPDLVRNAKDPVVNELQRLQDSKNGIIPTQFDKSAFAGKGGKGKKLTDAQVAQLNSLVNGKVKTVWGKMIADPRYKALSDEDKATALKSAKDSIATALKRQFAAKNNIASALTKPASAKSLYILSGEVPDFLASAASGTSVSPNLAKQYKTVLGHYGSMNTADRTKAFNTQKSAEYQYDEAKYQNDLANGTLTTAQKIRTQRTLQKEKVGSVYPKNVRDLYSLSKTELYNYLSTPEKGIDKTKIAKQLIAYDQALYNAGLETSLKFETGIAPSSGGSGSRSSLSPLGAQIKYHAHLAPPKLPKFTGLPTAPKYAPPTIKRLIASPSSETKFNYTIRKGLV